MKRNLAVSLIFVLLVSGCAMQTEAEKKSLLGAGFGAAIGAGLGQLVGGDTKSTLLGAGIGAALGGGAGYKWGQYLDQQEAALKKQFPEEGTVQIERDDEQISLTFKSDMMFDSGSPTIKASAQDEIVQVANVLNQYPETIIVVRGFTDSVGSEDSNLALSEHRAQSVKSSLESQKVDPDRIMTIGYGETEPVSDNDTDTGRRANRRVEITIANPETIKS